MQSPAVTTLDLDNEEFQLAIRLIAETNCPVFLTGKAGTGKSTFLRHILQNVDKNFVVVAPTGIAAVNVGGVTIHSFFYLPLRPILPGDEGIVTFKKHSPKRKIIEEMDTLLIDEVSMVRADMIDAIDTSLRRNGGNPHLPFGGKQVVLIGDLFQLEPVTIKDSGEMEVFKEYYESPFFFDAMIFKETTLLGVELQKVYRQQDEDFIALLDTIRSGEAGEDELELLNTRFLPERASELHDFTITLCARNDTAAQVNKQQMEKLTGRRYHYEGKVEGDFPENRYPVPQFLELRVGAQVMFLRNDTEKRWVNGTIGKVHRLEKDLVEIEMENGDLHPVEPVSWENIEYKFEPSAMKIQSDVKGSYKQYPLAPAWAITIHKSQGLTFDNVIIDLGKGAFAGGQVYVALSRCRSFEGLLLKSRVRPQDIFVEARVSEFGLGMNNYRLLERSIEEGAEEFAPIMEERRRRREIEKNNKEAKKAAKKETQNKSENKKESPFREKEKTAIREGSGVILTEALQLLDNKKYDAAINTFIKALEADDIKPEMPLHIKAYAFCKLGRARYGLQDYENAIMEYSVAIALDPVQPQFYFDRATAMQQMDEFENAIEDYTEALRLKPQFAQAYYNRGIAFYKLNCITEARCDWEAASKMGHEKARGLLRG